MPIILGDLQLYHAYLHFLCLANLAVQVQLLLDNERLRSQITEMEKRHRSDLQNAKECADHHVRETEGCIQELKDRAERRVGVAEECIQEVEGCIREVGEHHRADLNR